MAQLTTGRISLRRTGTYAGAPVAGFVTALHSRIIQEQGRPQLKAFNGNLWGTPKHPMCRGFTPEEFQALDFSKIDLSEYYADIEARAQSDIQVNMKDRVDAYLNAVRP